MKFFSHKLKQESSGEELRRKAKLIPEETPEAQKIRAVAAIEKSIEDAKVETAATTEEMNNLLGIVLKTMAEVVDDIKLSGDQKLINKVNEVQGLLVHTLQLIEETMEPIDK